LFAGVAQNSVLNGLIARELGFERVHIPSCVGDEGIAVGCALFGVNLLREEKKYEAAGEAAGEAAAAGEVGEVGGTAGGEYGPDGLLTAYLGKAYSMEEIEDAAAEFSNWAEPVELPEPEAEDNGPSQAELIAIALAELSPGAARDPPDAADRDKLIGQQALVVVDAARALARGELVAWFEGRSEFGPRALGSRSLLADPRNATLAKLLNRDVKKREAFRPFAPAVLAEEAPNWFEGLTVDGSPFMGLTVPVAKGKRGQVPGVLHGADGSARLQTVTRGLAPAPYRALIAVFFALTGVPLVLNTSFNVFPGEPIVESPRDALRAFLGGRGSGKRIDRLVFLAACLQLKPAGCPLNLGPQGQLLDPGTPAPGAAAKGPAPTTDPAPAPAPAGKKARTGQVVPGRSAGVRSKAKLAPQRQSPREQARRLVSRRRVEGFRSETVGLADGSCARVRVLASGVTCDAETWLDLFDELELALLEACRGGKTLGEILDDFVDDADVDSDEKGSDGEGGEVTEAEVLVRLRRLWEATLVEL